MGRPGQRTLLEERPDLVKEWHRVLNIPLSPDDIASRSSRRVWWRCSLDPAHEWQTAVAHRTRAGSGCPFCAGRAVSPTNSLAVSNLLVAAEWDAAKNGALTPANIYVGSTRKAWWRCSVDPSHSWRATVRKRALEGQGCPFCKHAPGSRPGLSRSLSAEWNAEKNRPPQASEVTRGSTRTVWWRCRRDPTHEWEATIKSRAEQGTRCPFCINKRADVANNLAAMHPQIAAEWHPQKNGALTPGDVVAGSGKMVWWKCPEGTDHEWEERVFVRTRNSPNCPFCVNQRVSNTNALAKTHPKLAKEWHPEKNGDLTPVDVVAGSNRMAWWRCKEGPDHEWCAQIAHRGVRGQGCPFCANQRLSITNTLASRFPALAAEWHPTKNEELRPSDVAFASNRKVWWKCAAGPDHEWETMVLHRTTNESSCPFCAGKRASVTNSIATLCPELASEWHPIKNCPLLPDDVTPGSQKRVWWKCAQGPDHEWDTPVHKRARRGDGCPYCSGRRVSVTNSLAAIHPQIAAEWNFARNGDVLPEHVLAASKNSYWWLCPRRHAWRASVGDRTVRGRHCPVCARELR